MLWDQEMSFTVLFKTNTEAKGFLHKTKTLISISITSPLPQHVINLVENSVCLWKNRGHDIIHLQITTTTMYLNLMKSCPW